ncbi:MAG: rhomboid family intramembrane serine protease [Bacteroidales bacterium]|nr:rhomboid family intramembrane serine protease [Bacteroidales bacterium]
MFWQNLKNQILAFFRSRTWLSRIVIADCIIWLCLIVADFVANYFTLKGEHIATDWVGKWLCVTDYYDFLQRPWTALTYFFVHTRFLSLLLNMVVLAVVGRMFYRYFGGRRFIATFLACGVAGAVPVLLATFLFKSLLFSPVLTGASAAVMGLLVALATYLPDYSLYFFPTQSKGFKFKYLALIFVAFDLLMALTAKSPSNMANLGGELCGFLMIYLPRLTGGLKIKLSEKSRRPRKGEPQHERPVSDEEYNRRRAENDRRIDEILDKISQSGYEKLTAEEKEFLFKSSNRNNS